MSDKAKSFVDLWIDKNVHATGYEQEGDTKVAKNLAKECLKECVSSGINRAEVKAAVGDLDVYMADAIERVNSLELGRLVDSKE